ncbi:MAG: endonuclease III [Acidobacteria bacterium]|nr:endonuclease III [Acidobacteriota bacterium]
MTGRERMRLLIERFRAIDPDPACELRHEDPFQLLVATILSAQCTDEQVNAATPGLFAAYPDANALAEAPIAELERLVHSTGFYRHKARHIRESARRIRDAFGGRVPDRMEDLLSLPGVARKTANVVLGNAFGVEDGIVVDTHVLRLSRRLGFTSSRDPKRVERDLEAVTPREHRIALSHWLIRHGRRTCRARRPACTDCLLADICPKTEVPT